MNGSATLLTDLTLGLSAAWLAGVVASFLRLNPILGYVVAGILIGPFAPGQIAHAQNIEGLATLGLIFLLFSLGLDFSFEELRSSGPKALWLNALTTSAAAGLAWICCRYVLGLAHPITAALTTAVSSTAVGVALLRDWKHEGEAASRFAITQQVVQDVFSIALLVVSTAPLESFSLEAVAGPLLQAIIFTAVSIVVGYTLLKTVVHKILRDSSTERLFIAFAALSMVAASISKYVGLSYEFGAFVAGAVISAATGTKMVSPIVAPFRAIFVALFFVSIGMLFRVSMLAAYIVPICGVGLVLLLGRFAFWYWLSRRRIERHLAGYSALAMTALGEFNCVLINEATAAHRLSPAEQQFLLGLVLFSIFGVMLIAPVFPRLVHRGARPETPEGTVTTASPLVAIIGFGRVGSAVGHVLRDAGVRFTALEYQRPLIEIARAGGFDIVFGEPLDPAALDRVILPSTRIVVTTVAEAPVNMAVAEHVARRYNVEIIARAGHGADITQLVERRGASQAYVPETEGALVFARAILEALEYDADLIDRCVEEERRSSRGLSISMEHDHHHLFGAAESELEAARET